MKRISLALCGWALFGLCAMTASASSERAWSSMLVSGVVDINPDGSVRDYRMDQTQKIPDIVHTVLKQTVPEWRFQVSTAHDIIAQAKMSIRVVAKPVDGGKMAFSVEGVSFGPQNGQSPDQLRVDSPRPSPVYPRTALHESASATAYMVARVGRDGHVMDVAAEQLNFTNPVAPRSRAKLEKEFIESSATAIRHWTFEVPTKGPDADAPYWLARVPVTFTVAVGNVPPKAAAYGSWQPYIPGPRLATPDWVQPQTGLASAPDALPDDGIALLTNRLQLAEPDANR